MDHENEFTETDARLADFTDRLLGGETAPIASASDEDLLRLQQTVLRVTHAFPPKTQTDAMAKQMLVRFKARAKREEAQAVKSSIWKRLFDFQSNPQNALLFAAVMVLVVAVVALPFLQSPGSAVAGAALTGGNFYIVAGLVLALLVVYWFSRK